METAALQESGGIRLDSELRLISDASGALWMLTPLEV